jgi:hypothetical protein
MRCPACKQDGIQRSRSRRGRERFVRFVLLRKYYRCPSCNWRGGIPVFTAKSIAKVARTKRRQILTILTALGMLLAVQLCSLRRAAEYQPTSDPNVTATTP